MLLTCCPLDRIQAPPYSIHGGSSQQHINFFLVAIETAIGGTHLIKDSWGIRRILGSLKVEWYEDFERP